MTNAIAILAQDTGISYSALGAWSAGLLALVAVMQIGDRLWKHKSKSSRSSEQPAPQPFMATTLGGCAFCPETAARDAQDFRDLMRDNVQQWNKVATTVTDLTTLAKIQLETTSLRYAALVDKIDSLQRELDREGGNRP